MKLLLIHDTLDSMGGAEILFQDHVALLRKSGHVVYTFSFSRNKQRSIPNYIQRESSFFPKRALEKIFFNLGAYQSLKRLVNQFQPDIIHSYHNFQYPVSVLTALSNSIPIIQSINDYHLICASTWGVNKKTGKECECGFSLKSVKNGCLPFFRYILFFFQNKAMRYLTKKKVNLFFVTHIQIKNKLQRQGFKNVKILPHFYQTVNLKTKTNKQINKTVLFIGKLTKEKGCQILLKAINQSQKIFPDIKAIIIGNGPEKQALIRQTKKLGISQKVNFIGRVSRIKLEEFYQQTMIIVVPSIWMENSSLVIIEAMAAGKPIIASRIGGIPSLIKNGQNGYLFKPRDYEELAKKIVLLINNENLRKKIGKNAQLSYKKYTPENYYKKLMKIYKSLL